MTDFNSWLEQELNKRGWSQSELSRRTTNLSQGYISLVLSGRKPPSWDFCNSVAAAFGYSPVEVFRIAGLLPDDKSLITQKVVDISSRLPDLKKEDLLNYARYLAQTTVPIAN